MMLVLGGVLLFDPNLLHNVIITIVLMAVAVVLSLILILLDKKLKPKYRK